MSRYIVRRLAFAALLVIVVSSASMILARLAPGDYVDLSLPPEASAEAKAYFEDKYSYGEIRFVLKYMNAGGQEG